MNAESIMRYIIDTFDGVDAVVASQEAGSPEVAWGDTFFFYDPGCMLPSDHKFPFATIVTKDYGEFDNASNLYRPSVFRLNIGISKPTYQSLFGSPSSRLDAGGAVDAGHDFSALDQLMPHPVYGKMFWVCLLNPSDATFQTVRPLLSEAYDLDVIKYTKREALGVSLK